MSMIHPDTHLDLIDFQVGSPVLPRRSSISEVHFEQDSENLIDTELPVFEQKLQTASSVTGCHSRRNSIDVEDILINIDSDEYETDSLDGETVETANFLDVCNGISVENGNNETVLPVDNFEALLVLKNLDDLLNATLEESNDIIDGNSNNHQHTSKDLVESDENTQQIIEECLQDLDNYLKAIEDDDSVSHTSSRSFSSDDQSGSRDSSSFFDFAGSSIFEEQEDSQAEFNEELARSKLRKIEQNYSKFVSSGIINRGYVDTENDAYFTCDGQLRRPSSACTVTNQLFSRKQPHRATTLAVVRKERPKLLARRKSLNENNTAPHCTLSRTSGADEDCNSPENWLTSTDVTRERHAHASGDCCTGTVIVEPLRRQSKANSSSASVVNEVLHAAVPKEEVRRTLRGTWIRSSMRRLQHLNLPSAESAEDESAAGNGEMDLTRLEVPSNVRPVSAPSRLPPSRTSTERSSRSRSRDSVSHEPNGRARSSSASSHSRRRRSLSSSVTSLASSVESTLSRMPSSDTTRNGTSVREPTTNVDIRRYSFLITGIVYGVVKHKALQVYEASRADVKARRRAERDIRIIEEKRLAAVSDFNQIVEIFTPPAKYETTKDITVTEQDLNLLTQGVNAPSSSSKIIGKNNQFDLSHRISVIDPDIPKKDTYSQPDIPETSVIETDILETDDSSLPDEPKTDEFLQPDFPQSIPITEPDMTKTDEFLQPDFPQSIPITEPDITKTDDFLQLDNSEDTPVSEADISKTNYYSPYYFSESPVTEPDITKTGDSTPDNGLNEQPVDILEDDVTQYSDGKGGNGNMESKDTKSDGRGSVELSDYLEDSGYIIKDFDDISVDEKDRFPPED